MNEINDQDLFDRVNYAKSLIAYMNYDNPDKKYDDIREKELKKTYGERVLLYLGRIYSKKPNDSEFYYANSIVNKLMAYINYDNNNPKWDEYRKKESRETYGEDVLNSICEANKNVNFDDPYVLEFLTYNIRIVPKPRRL